MDPCVYEMMMNLRATKAAQEQASGVKVTVKNEPGIDTPSSSKKRKRTEDAAEQGLSRHEPSTPLGHAHGSFLGASASPPGFSTQKSSKISRERDHDPMPQNMALKPDGGGTTADWEAARQMLQSIVTPALEKKLSAAKPFDVIASSYITALQVFLPFRFRPWRATRFVHVLIILTRSRVVVVGDALAQAANYASFSLGYALELEEKLAAREREADALRQELSQAKAELADAKKVAAEELRSAREAAVREYRGSTEQVLRFAEHALAGYEKGMEDMKRAVLRRYPHLDPEQLVVPAAGGGAQ